MLDRAQNPIVFINYSEKSFKNISLDKDEIEGEGDWNPVTIDLSNLNKTTSLYGASGEKKIFVPRQQRILFYLENT